MMYQVKQIKLLSLVLVLDYLNTIFLVKYKKVFPQNFLDLIPFLKVIEIDELMSYKPKKKQKIDVV